MFWRMYIKAARKDPDRPRIGGYPSTPSSRSQASSSSNSSSARPVAHSIMMTHSFRGHGGVSSTPTTPHGNGPSPYRLPEMTQDTPRITFQERMQEDALLEREIELFDELEDLDFLQYGSRATS